jgi:hypothetical protein
MYVHMGTSKAGANAVYAPVPSIVSLQNKMLTVFVRCFLGQRVALVL